MQANSQIDRSPTRRDRRTFLTELTYSPATSLGRCMEITPYRPAKAISVPQRRIGEIVKWKRIENEGRCMEFLLFSPSHESKLRQRLRLADDLPYGDVWHVR